MPLLLPMASDREIDCKIGFIPHWSEFDNFANNIYPTLHSDTKAESRLIDFRSTQIESTIKEIWKCQLILSSSLHGIIIAQAYGIPALWVRNDICGTDPFKFHDYFSSLDIPLYQPIDIADIVDCSPQEIETLFSFRSAEALPDMTTIALIQHNLLDAFPY